MATYVTSKCPRCKYVFERFEPSWISFGDPRITCPKCGLIVLFKNIKEWKLRSILNRIWITFQYYTFHNLVFTLSIMLVIFILLCLIPLIFGKSYSDLINESIETTFWTILGTVIFLVIAFFRHKSFIQEIKESNKRMEDKSYVDQIKKLY